MTLPQPSTDQVESPESDTLSSQGSVAGVLFLLVTHVQATRPDGTRLATDIPHSLHATEDSAALAITALKESGCTLTDEQLAYMRVDRDNLADIKISFPVVAAFSNGQLSRHFMCFCDNCEAMRLISNTFFGGSTPGL